MKKLALVIMVTGMLGLSACKKCSTCTTGNTISEYCSDIYSSKQIKAFETTCVLGGGTWE